MILFYIADPTYRKVIEQNAGFLAEPAPLFGLQDEVFEFRYCFADNVPHLASILVELLHVDRCPSLVLVSDRLLSESNPRELSQVGKVVREVYFGHGRAASLIALTKQRDSYQDAFVTPCNFSQFDIPQLRADIVRSAARLTILAPPRSATSKATRADDSGPLQKPQFTIKEVSSQEELMSCLRLRHQVYDLLGYLKPEVSAGKLRIDIDYHDGMSLHFVAIDNASGLVVGTFRLILPHQPWGLVGSGTQSLKDVFRSHQEWFRSISQDVPETSIRLSLMDAGPTPLPMLRNIRLSEQWRELLIKAAFGAEISRVIVDPRCRGSGISRALVHVAVVRAIDLQRKALFAECFPNHTAMYQKYGFEEIEGRQACLADKSYWDGFLPDSLVMKLTESSQSPCLSPWDLLLYRLAQQNVEELKEKIPIESPDQKPNRQGGSQS